MFLNCQQVNPQFVQEGSIGVVFDFREVEHLLIYPKAVNGRAELTVMQEVRNDGYKLQPFAYPMR